MVVTIVKCEWNWGATVRERQRFCVVITLRVYPTAATRLICCERTLWYGVDSVYHSCCESKSVISDNIAVHGLGAGHSNTRRSHVVLFAV